MGLHKALDPFRSLPWKRLPFILAFKPCNETTKRRTVQVRPVFDQIAVELLYKLQALDLGFLSQDEFALEVWPALKRTLLVVLLFFELLRSVVWFCPWPSWLMRMRVTPLEELCVRFSF